MSNQKQVVDKVKQILADYNKKMDELKVKFNQDMETAVSQEMKRIESEQQSQENPEVTLEQELNMIS